MSSRQAGHENYEVLPVGVGSEVAVSDKPRHGGSTERIDKLEKVGFDVVAVVDWQRVEVSFETDPAWRYPPAMQIACRYT